MGHKTYVGETNGQITEIISLHVTFINCYGHLVANSNFETIFHRKTDLRERARVQDGLYRTRPSNTEHKRLKIRFKDLATKSV